MDLERAEQEGVTQCLLLPGEIIVVPDNWWHATCNLLPYTVAMGAQLWVEPRRYDLRSPPPLSMSLTAHGASTHSRRQWCRR